MFISSNLKVLRKEKLLTQAQVADSIGVNSSTYNKYESGNVEPNLSTLLAMAELFEVSVDKLLREDIPPLPQSNVGISLSVDGSGHSGITQTVSPNNRSTKSINAENGILHERLLSSQQRILDLEAQLKSKDDTIAIQKELIEVLKQKNTPT